jgi:hypothetical protein
MLTFRNPPPQLLEKEIAPLSDFAIYCCLISPKLELHRLDVTSNGDLHHVRLVVQNTGWLPTNVTQKAVDMKVVRELEADISLPEGARLVSGRPKMMLGQLAGRDHKSVYYYANNDATGERAKAEWVVEAPPGTEITITAAHPRAGTVRTTVRLGD